MSSVSSPTKKSTVYKLGSHSALSITAGWSLLAWLACWRKADNDTRPRIKNEFTEFRIAPVVFLEKINGLSIVLSQLVRNKLISNKLLSQSEKKQRKISDCPFSSNRHEAPENIYRNEGIALKTDRLALWTPRPPPQSDNIAPILQMRCSAWGLLFCAINEIKTTWMKGKTDRRTMAAFHLLIKAATWEAEVKYAFPEPSVPVPQIYGFHLDSVWKSAKFSGYPSVLERLVNASEAGGPLSLGRDSHRNGCHSCFPVS